MERTNLLGRKVYITNKESIYFGEWGTVCGYDGEFYHVAIADGRNSIPVFDRDEFRVPRKGR